jgi:hypothetical protein
LFAIVKIERLSFGALSRPSQQLWSRPSSLGPDNHTSALWLEAPLPPRPGTRFLLPRCTCPCAAIDDIEEPVGVTASNIAGTQPAERSEASCGFGRQPPISRTDIRTADDDLAVPRQRRKQDRRRTADHNRRRSTSRSPLRCRLLVPAQAAPPSICLGLAPTDGTQTFGFGLPPQAPRLSAICSIRTATIALLYGPWPRAWCSEPWRLRRCRSSRRSVDEGAALAVTAFEGRKTAPWSHR